MNNPTFDQISFKASHNSYHRKESLEEQLTFDPTTPHNGGCLGIELDIWRRLHKLKSDADYFSVGHLSPTKTSLASYFTQLQEWHQKNTNHLPVLVTLDIKSTGDYLNFDHDIDDYIHTFFNESLVFKPQKLITNPSISLIENVRSTGWPTIDSPDMLGKFIFCLSGNQAWKTNYASHHLVEKLCFSDTTISLKDNPSFVPSKGNVLFYNFHVKQKNKDQWMNYIPKFTANKLISRAYVVDHEVTWKDCVTASVSALATNKITHETWAYLNNKTPYITKTPF